MIMLCREEKEGEEDEQHQNQIFGHVYNGKTRPNFLKRRPHNYPVFLRKKSRFQYSNNNKKNIENLKHLGVKNSNFDNF